MESSSQLKLISQFQGMTMNDEVGKNSEMNCAASFTAISIPLPSHCGISHQKQTLHEFYGVVTGVSREADLFLFHVDSEERLIYIKSKLTETFQGTEPNDDDLQIQPGDLGVAWFYLDNFWHRVTILDVSQRNPRRVVKVLFDDYGTEMEVNSRDIRKTNLLRDEPIYSIRCKIHNIKPPGSRWSWSSNALDFLHKICVEKTFLVRVHSHSPLRVSLFNEIVGDVAQCLVRARMAQFAPT